MSGVNLVATAASARSLLLTLLGEFVYPARGPVWTSTLLRALSAAGVAEKAARQALARAQAAGWIEGDKAGRQSRWSLAAEGQRLIAEGSHRVGSLRRAADNWDGCWLLLHVTIPESRRADRLRLYRSLQWMGFGSPTAGFWICPHADRAEALHDRIRQLKLGDDAMAFTARSLPFGLTQPELVQRAWDLESLAAHYRELEAHFDALRPRAREALFAGHVQLVNVIQRLPMIDPGLPLALLPMHWEGARVSSKLTALRARWREAAHERWQALDA